MASARFEMRLPGELVDRIDGARGVASRAAWIRWAVERALEAESAPAHDRVVNTRTGEELQARAVASSGSSVPAFNRASSLGGAARPIPRRS